MQTNIISTFKSQLYISYKCVEQIHESKEKKIETENILLLLWQWSRLPGQKFWKSFRRIARDVSIYFGKNKVFLYLPLKSYNTCSLNTWSMIWEKGGCHEQAGGWMERDLEEDCKVKANISGKCKIKLPKITIVSFKTTKDNLFKNIILTWRLPTASD